MIDDLNHAIDYIRCNHGNSELLTIVLSPRGLSKLQKPITIEKLHRLQESTAGGFKIFVEKNQIEPFRIVIR